jgi:hypothetical protein
VTGVSAEVVIEVTATGGLAVTEAVTGGPMVRPKLTSTNSSATAFIWTIRRTWS